MKNTVRLIGIVGVLVGCVFVAQAQQPGKVPLIGYLSTTGDPSNSLFLSEEKIYVQETAAADTENVLVYPSIAVTVNKSVVIRLPRNATRVTVTQPQIAEVVVVTPDQLLINGKAVGTTSLVVWVEETGASMP